MRLLRMLSGLLAGLWVRRMAKTVEDVKASIDSLFSDTSCSQEETRERMEEIVEHIEICLESLA